METQKLSCAGSISAHTCLYDQNLCHLPSTRTSSSPLCTATEQPLRHVLPPSLHPRIGNIASDYIYEQSTDLKLVKFQTLNIYFQELLPIFVSEQNKPQISRKLFVAVMSSLFCCRNISTWDDGAPWGQADCWGLEASETAKFLFRIWSRIPTKDLIFES